MIERALQLADAESLAAVSIRRLASDFHVTPMALYWHVKNKDELLAAMGDDFYDHIEISDLAGRDWFEVLRLVVERLVSSLRRHPASAGLAVARILHSERGQVLTELTLSVLRDAGFSVGRSADVARTALHTAVTLVAGLPGAELDVPADERDAALARKRAEIAALPADRFPCLRVSGDALTGCEDAEDYFEAGTEFFLAGVQAMQRRLPSGVDAP
ncbi:MAG: transcriptional regulator, TetR family [Frankiales bacterium]|nr:transcriptional regulator, TetR family [Frankiales bacterium]